MLPTTSVKIVAPKFEPTIVVRTAFRISETSTAAPNVGAACDPATISPTVDPTSEPTTCVLTVVLKAWPIFYAPTNDTKSGPTTSAYHDTVAAKCQSKTLCQLLL